MQDYTDQLHFKHAEITFWTTVRMRVISYKCHPYTFISVIQMCNIDNNAIKKQLDS